MTLELGLERREPPAPAPSPEVAPVRDPLLIADTPESADLTGVGRALEPILELCLSPQAQTPFVVGMVGPAGSGKSFALRRFAGSLESLAQKAVAPLLNRIVVARWDAASAEDDIAPALAAAAFAALEREIGGVGYVALADEASHATADPRRAALAAAERHDELSRRLDAERSARDELESRRARLSDALLYETPGTRVDSMIRTYRATIEARLRRFGLGEGETAANYRDLVRDLASLKPAGRIGVWLRSLWAYQGQTTLALTAVFAAAAAVGLDRLRAINVEAAVRGLGSTFEPAANLLAAHGDWAEWGVEALAVIALLAAFVNAWRALSFNSLLYRGLRLLDLDIRDRRRELEAGLARIERRVLSLTMEVEAASRRAESLARRAGGGASVTRAPGPSFLAAADSPRAAARSFFKELARMMSAPSQEVPAPQRLVLVIDNLDALPAETARRALDSLRALLGENMIAAIACGGAERARFDAMLNVSAVGAPDAERLAARILASGPELSSLAEPRLPASRLSEPLTPVETALLASLATLTDGTPAAVKRFYNAYRLARVGAAPRPLVAMMVAALHSPDAESARVLREALCAGGDIFQLRQVPARLVAGWEAVRLTEGMAIPLSQARMAWDAARRFSPMDV